MDIVLLERVDNLGQIGDVVKVRPGYARNFLLPQKKALRATKSNLEYFEKQKADLHAQNQKRREEAEKASKKIDGLKVVIIRQASEGGQLYGSVAARDVAEAVNEAGHKIERRQIAMQEMIKILGIFPVKIVLHPEISVQITVNIARSAEEAKIQAAGGKPGREKAEAEEQPEEDIFGLNEEQPEV